MLNHPPLGLIDFEFESAHKFFMNLNFVFSKSMNLNFVFSKSMNLNFVFSWSMNLNIVIKHLTNLRVFRFKPYKANVAICNRFLNQLMLHTFHKISSSQQKVYDDKYDAARRLEVVFGHTNLPSAPAGEWTLHSIARISYLFRFL